jgi:hypothetical protein
MTGGGNQPQNHEHYDLQLPYLRREGPASGRIAVPAGSLSWG